MRSAFTPQTLALAARTIRTLILSFGVVRLFVFGAAPEDMPV